MSSETWKTSNSSWVYDFTPLTPAAHADDAQSTDAAGHKEHRIQSRLDFQQKQLTVNIYCFKL